MSEQQEVYKRVVAGEPLTQVAKDMDITKTRANQLLGAAIHYEFSTLGDNDLGLSSRTYNAVCRHGDIFIRKDDVVTVDYERVRMLVAGTDYCRGLGMVGLAELAGLLERNGIPLMTQQERWDSLVKQGYRK